MPSTIETYDNEWFLDPKKGWSQTETEQTLYKLKTHATLDVFVQVDNDLHIKNPRGGWNTVGLDLQSGLPGLERALVFILKPIENEEGSFVEILSTRFIDETLINLLFQDIELLDNKFKPLINPLIAIDTVFIHKSDKQKFADRVISYGGKVQEEKADLEAMNRYLDSLSKLSAELEQLCRTSRYIIDKLAHGIESEIPTISEKSQTAYRIREKAVRLVAQIEKEEEQLKSQAGNLEFKAYARAYIIRAREWLEKIQQLEKEQKSYEVQAAIRINESSIINMISTDIPIASRKYLFMPVAEFYTELGYDCRLSEDAGNLILRVEDKILELSDQVKVKTAKNASYTNDKPYIRQEREI